MCFTANTAHINFWSFRHHVYSRFSCVYTMRPGVCHISSVLEYGQSTNPSKNLQILRRPLFFCIILCFYEILVQGVRKQCLVRLVVVSRNLQ